MTTRRLLICLLACLLLASCARDEGSGTGGEATAGVDLHRFETPREIATGLLDGMTPDGSGAYVEEPDPELSEPGCEGMPEPVMFRIPLAGGDRTVVGDQSRPLRGALLRGGSQGRVAVIAGCESFFTALFVAQESGDGTLAGVTEVTPAIPDDFLLSPDSVSWSNDGVSLLGALRHVDGPDGEPSPVVSIDPDSGEITRLFDAEQGSGVSGVGQLENGMYVVSTDLAVTLRDSEGVVTAGFQSRRFEIAPDGRRVAVYGNDVRLVSQGSTNAELVLEAAPGREISAVRFAPSGGAVVIERSQPDGGRSELGIVTLDDRRYTSVVTGDQYGRAYFSGDGRALGFNRFGPAPDFTSTVYLTRFAELE